MISSTGRHSISTQVGNNQFGHGPKSSLLIDPTMSTESTEFVKNSVLYKEFLAEREEILRHKWLESEKAGHDIGFEKALLDWIIKHRTEWRNQRHTAE